MVQRTPLIEQLTQAWRKTIAEAYCERLINSERCLQAYFCAELLVALRAFKNEDHWRLFIEPHLPGIKGNEKGCSPDILICNSRGIIGVIELKYQPLRGPSTNKDLKTLEAIAVSDVAITLQNDRYVGNSPLRSYGLTDDAVLCWAGVYSGDHDRPSLVDRLDEGIRHRFLQLDAVTHQNKNPDIWAAGAKIPFESDSSGTR